MTILGIVLFHTVSFGNNLLFLGTMCLTVILGMIPHELGHALAALGLGLRLFTVSFGAKGRILFVWRVLGYDLAFHSILLGGYVLYAPRHLCFARLRHFLAVLAGPLTDGLLILIAMYFLAGTSSNDLSFHVLAGFIYGNVLMLVVNLFPRKFWRNNRPLSTDGLLAFTTPFMSQKTLETWHSSTFYFEAME